MGVKRLRRIQIGAEATKGTEVNADIIWRGTGTIDDGIEVTFVDEDVGYLGGVDRTYVPTVIGYLSMDPCPATFEHLPHILEAGVRTDAPAQDGTGSGYIYEYLFPTTTASTIKTYTIEGGDDDGEEQMLYGFVNAFSLTAAPKEAVMMSADWTGRQVAPGTFTAMPTFTVVEEMFFGKSKLYIDTTGSTFGNNQITSTMLGWELNVSTGWIPKFTGDGNLYFTYEENVGPEVLLSMTMEHNASTLAELVAWRAETPRLIRVKVEGSALTTSGAYTYKTVLIDLAGKWESFDKIGEVDGNDIRRGVFRARYNSTAEEFAQITVVNELSSLP